MVIACCCAVAAAPVMAQPKKAPAPKGPKRPPPAPTPEKLRADKLFEDGRRYLTAKEYALACTAFEQSHQADPAIGTLLNIALCYEEWGKLAAAYRAYVEAEKLAQARADDREKGARQKIDELSPRVPHLTVTIPADTDVAMIFTFDGKDITRTELTTEMLLEAGKHVIEAKMTGRPTKTTEVVLRQGERRVIDIEVPRREIKTIVRQGPRKKTRLYAGLAVGGAGVIAMGLASVIAFGARSEYADAIIDCPAGVCQSRASFEATQDARSKANLMTFVGAGGLALAGVGVFLFITSKGDRIEEKITTVMSPVVGPDSVGIMVRGRL